MDTYIYNTQVYIYIIYIHVLIYIYFFQTLNTRQEEDSDP